jgi:hypothetical protein
MDEAVIANPAGESIGEAVLGQQSDSGFLGNIPGIAFTIEGSLVVDSGMTTGRHCVGRPHRASRSGECQEKPIPR